MGGRNIGVGSSCHMAGLGSVMIAAVECVCYYLGENVVRMRSLLDDCVVVFVVWVE